MARPRKNPPKTADPFIEIDTEYLYRLVQLGDISYPGSLDRPDFPSRSAFQSYYGEFFHGIQLLPVDADESNDCERNFHHFASLSDPAYWEILRKVYADSAYPDMFSVMKGMQNARKLFMDHFDATNVVMWCELEELPNECAFGVEKQWFEQCPVIEESKTQAFEWCVCEGEREVMAARIVTQNDPHALVLCRTAIPDRMQKMAVLPDDPSIPIEAIDVRSS